MRFIHRIITVFISTGMLSGCSIYVHKLTGPNPNVIQQEIVEILENEYPFTEHKGTDWHQFAREMQVMLVGDEFNEDAYLKTRSRIYDMPDSRVNIFSNQDQKLREKETSGSIGFELAFAPPDKYIVARIDSQSEAWQKGLRPGYEIIGWNGRHINDAIKKYPLRWGFHPSTEEFRKILACHWISKGTPDTSAEVFYINEQENNKGVRLKYIENQGPDFPSYIRIPDKNTIDKHEFRILTGRIGYLRFDHFVPGSSSFFRKQVLDSLPRLSGLIIDLRENSGGYDAVAVEIAGHFITEGRLYEESFILDDGEYNIFGSYYTKPVEAPFTKNIILITGPMTMGVAEGFVNVLKEEEHVRTLGSWSTAGSFSLPGGQIKLSRGMKLNYPIGGAFDQDHNIILESGKWIKGIYPDVYITPTKELVMLMANGYDALLEEAIGHIRK